MILRTLTVMGLTMMAPLSAMADVHDQPQRTLHYEISSDLGGQRAAVAEHRRHRHDMIANKYAQAHDIDREDIRARIESRFGHLTEAERETKLEELHQYRQKLRAELEQLPPEARMERMKELRQAYEENGLAAFDETIEEEPDVEQAE